MKEREADLKQNLQAHHKHLHEALYCLTRSVAAGHSGMTQTNQKLGFESHNTTAFYGRQYQKHFLNLLIYTAQTLFCSRMVSEHHG